MTPEALLLLVLTDWSDDLEELLAEFEIEPIDALVVLFEAGFIPEEKLKEMVGL